jgi:hypothetical protein
MPCSMRTLSNLIQPGILTDRLTEVGPLWRCASRACATGRREPTIRRASASHRQSCRLRPAFEEPPYTDPDPLSERRVNDFAPLAALLGKDAPGLSATGTTCWHSVDRYDYPASANVVVHPYDWQGDRGAKYAWREHTGHGYWRGNQWQAF